MTKPTVLLCGPPASAVGGGPTHMVNMLASPLKDRYTLIHFESGSRGAESPAKDEGLFAKVFRIIASPFALAWQIMCTRPAVVHLNSALNHKAFWRDLIYVLVSKLFRRKVVFQLHGGSLEKLCAKPGMRRFVRKVFTMPDALVLLAKSEMRDFKQLGITDGLSVIPNGVDVAQYSGANERARSSRVCRLAFMGRLIRAKGIFEAMEAVRLLRAERDFRNIELWIAGSGLAKDEIEHWIRVNAMESGVKLVGSIYGKDKVDFLREADVFVLPTYHGEGLPYAILESLAAGTPVITTKVGGIPDIVVDRVHGILIDAKNPQQIVSAVHELARSEEELRAMSKNCRALASHELGLERLASRFGELYERIRA